MKELKYIQRDNVKCEDYETKRPMTLEELQVFLSAYLFWRSDSDIFSQKLDGGANYLVYYSVISIYSENISKAPNLEVSCRIQTKIDSSQTTGPMLSLETSYFACYTFDDARLSV